MADYAEDFGSFEMLWRTSNSLLRISCLIQDDTLVTISLDCNPCRYCPWTYDLEMLKMAALEYDRLRMSSL